MVVSRWSLVVRNSLPATNDQQLTTNHCLLSHFQRRLEPEAERGLVGENEFLFYGKFSFVRTRPGALGGAHQRPLSPPAQGARARPPASSPARAQRRSRCGVPLPA